ncbi:MAG: hypothetical protein LC749_12915 [Actinobacteria bacterium]|nr:hypothetical protein [Actinomycetota bacterium]
MGRHKARARRSELDGEWDAIQSAADLGHYRRVLRGDRKIGAALGGSHDEQSHGAVLGKHLGLCKR